MNPIETEIIEIAKLKDNKPKLDKIQKLLKWNKPEEISQGLNVLIAQGYVHLAINCYDKTILALLLIGIEAY